MLKWSFLGNQVQWQPSRSWYRNCQRLCDKCCRDTSVLYLLKEGFRDARRSIIPKSFVTVDQCIAICCCRICPCYSASEYTRWHDQCQLASMARSSTDLGGSRSQCGGRDHRHTLGSKLTSCASLSACRLHPPGYLLINHTVRMRSLQ